MDWSGAEPVAVTIDSPAVGINFELGLGGQIAGTITDQDTGEPVTEGVWINAQPATGEPWGTGTNQIEPNGSYVIYGLPTGTYKISVQASGYDQEMYQEETDWMMADTGISNSWPDDQRNKLNSQERDRRQNNRTGCYARWNSRRQC